MYCTALLYSLLQERWERKNSTSSLADAAYTADPSEAVRTRASCKPDSMSSGIVPPHPLHVACDLMHSRLQQDGLSSLPLSTSTAKLLAEDEFIRDLISCGLFVFNSSTVCD